MEFLRELHFHYRGMFMAKLFLSFDVTETQLNEMMGFPTDWKDISKYKK